VNAVTDRKDRETVPERWNAADLLPERIDGRVGQ